MEETRNEQEEQEEIYLENEKRLCTKYGIIRPTHEDDDLEYLVTSIDKKLDENPNWKKDWVNKNMLQRFLRANIYLDKTEEALENYFNWRVEQNIDDLTNDDPDIMRESTQGRSLIVDDQLDYCGRPIMLVFVRKHDRHHGNYESLFKFVIHELEKVSKRSDKCLLKSYTIVFDLHGFGMRNMDFHYVKNFLHYLRDYYPERLGEAFIINYPAIFYGCWKVIKYWMNEVTKSKMLFAGPNELNDFMDVSKLPAKLFK